MKNIILKILIGSIVFEALVICIFILIGDYDEVFWKSVGSGGLLIGYSIPCLFYSRIFDKDKYKNIANTGVILVCVATVLSIFALWDVFGSNEIISNIIGTLSVTIGFLAILSWLLSYDIINNLFNKFKVASIVLSSLLGFYNICIIWSEFPEGFLSRLYFMILVLTIGSYISTYIITRIHKGQDSNDQNNIVNNQLQ